MSPALAGGFLTTGPPGKPHLLFLLPLLSVPQASKVLQRELSSREQAAAAGCCLVLLEDRGGFLRECPLVLGTLPTITGESYLL